MISVTLIELIENNATNLADDVARDLATNERTPAFSTVPADELAPRVFQIYHHLGNWIGEPGSATVRNEFAEWGARRFGQGVPLSQVVYAVVVIKSHLRRYIREHGLLDAAFPRGLVIQGHGSASVLRSPLWKPPYKPVQVLELWKRPDVRLTLRNLVLDGRKSNAAQIVTDLFHAFMQNPREMQSHYWYDQIQSMPEPAKARQVGDYLAGMTDTFAIATHNRLFDQTPDLR